MNAAFVQTVCAQLGHDLIEAREIARRLEVRPEDVYRALVRLHDQGVARVGQIDPSSHLQGWELAVDDAPDMARNGQGAEA